MRLRAHDRADSAGKPGLSPAALVAAILVGITSLLLSSSAAAQLYLPAADSLRTVIAASGSAQPRFDSTASVDDFVAYARQTNPALQRAYFNWEASLARVGYAGALMNPMVSYRRPLKRMDPQMQMFGVMQTLPWPGTLGARKSMAAEEANAAYREFQAADLQLVNSVRAAYYDLYYLGRQIELTRENLELLELWESVVRARYSVALGKHPDIIKAQIELGSLENMFLTLQDRLNPTMARLRATVNLPDSTTLPVPVTIDSPELVIDRKLVQHAVAENNPDLQSLAHRIDGRRAGVRLVSLAARPSVTLGVEYETGTVMNARAPEGTMNIWSAGITLDLPIWLGKNRAQVRESQAQLRAAELNHHNAENQISAAVDQLLFEYNDSLRKLRLYRDGLIPKAEQALQANFTAYQAGETDFLNLLDAQRQLLAFQLEFEQAQTDLAKRHSELEVMIGGNLEDLHQTHATEGAR